MDDDHCPICNSTEIHKTGDIRWDCKDCHFWWNDYELDG